MEKVRRFDNFKWLLSCTVVKENKQPDEKVLVYDEHGGFHIGLQEIYFVEGFYSMYVRDFGASFIQSQLDTLENETARLWADYAMSRIPDVIRYENENFKDSLEDLLDRLNLPMDNVLEVFRPYMPFITYGDYFRFALTNADSPLFRYFYILLILLYEYDYPEDETIVFPYTYATCPQSEKDKCSEKEQCKSCNRCYWLEYIHGKDYDFAEELNDFQKEMTNDFLSSMPKDRKEAMLVKLYEAIQQVNQSGIFAAKLSLSYDKVLYGGKKPLTGSFYLRWDKVDFFNGFYIVYHPDVPYNRAKPYRVDDECSRKAFNDISSIFLKKLPPLYVKAENGQIVNVMNRTNLSNCISIMEHKVARANVKRTKAMDRKQFGTRELTKLEAKSLCRDMKSRYLDYLCARQLDNYKVVYCVESRVNASGAVTSECSFVFTIGETADKVILAYENASDSRCTYVFPVSRRSWKEGMEKIYEYFASNEVNKRQSMAQRSVDLRLPGHYEYRRVFHSDYLDWADTIRLYARR